MNFKKKDIKHIESNYNNYEKESKDLIDIKHIYLMVGQNEKVKIQM